MKKKCVASFLIAICAAFISCSGSGDRDSIEANLKVSLPDRQTEKNDLIVDFHDQQYFEVTDSVGRAQYRFDWRSATAQFSDADTIYPIGWNSHFSRYWFYSAVPGVTSYFGYYDRVSCSVRLFSPPTKSDMAELTFDAESETFLYSDYDHPQDDLTMAESKPKRFSLWWHDFFGSKTVALSQKTGSRFEPRVLGPSVFAYVNSDGVVSRRSVQVDVDG